MSDGMKRRTFLKVLGAGGASTAAVGCTTSQVERLSPYVMAPEEVVPGVPTWYATTCRECPAGCGMHVETHEGRATKAEGNPDHPVSRGNLCARGQASVQGLYHPDRYRGPQLFEFGIPEARSVGWPQAERVLAQEIQRAGPGGVVLLTGQYRGTMDTLADAFAAAVGARRVVYAPMEDAPRDLDLATADLIVSFGADFLETWGSPVEYARQFKEMHGYRNGRRGRFVWVGPHRPLTGLSADLWIQTLPGTEALVAQALAGAGDLAQVAQQTGPAEGVQQRLQALQELQSWWGESGSRVALGPGLSVAGSNAGALRGAVDALNGRASGPAADLRPIAQLVEQMNADQVRVLLIDAHDPVYSLPASIPFARAMQRVPVRVSFSSFPDDTARHATHLLPQSHFLERWDDYAPRAGVFSLVQPAMKPVFNTRPVGEVLLNVAALLGSPLVPAETEGSPWLAYLRAAWAGRAGSEQAWREAVRNGGVYGAAAGAPATPPVAAGAAPAPAATGLARPAAYDGPDDGLHLVVYPSLRFFDGRTANRPWLLELPDPVTKVPWDSFAEMHPDTAEERGLRHNDEVELASPAGSVRLRVYVYPGVVRGAVAVQMGLGHEGFGRWTEGVGVNPLKLLGGRLDPESGALLTAGTRVSVRKTDGSRSRLVPKGFFEQGVRVQHDRSIAQAIGLSQLTRLDQQGHGHIPGETPGEAVYELKGAGGFAPEKVQPDPAQSYPPPGTEYGEYIPGETRWGMVVDLARCTGCAACVVACNAENNIPVVGPTEMRKGRELHWLRIERYFGTGRDPAEALADGATDDVRFLPMLCQHCGQAPCEPVCPVYAAYHTPDGLNAQVYNRCVGTRYCANNCPWKVRVFNWFTYEFAEPLNWQLNPDVTVREKGVMEKCTFCVQRIHEAGRRAAAEMREVRDGEVVPACVQTCPTQVFAFGDMSDPESEVVQAARTNRSYRTFEVLNTHPAIVYLKKVTLKDDPENGFMASLHAEPGLETPAQGAH
jgi:anaerobic selenocysteine-containing dehydrogenase/Fe-S-cluster-containing dehydrogenase component